MYYISLGTRGTHHLLCSSASEFLLDARKAKQAQSVSPNPSCEPVTLSLPLLSPTSVTQLQGLVENLVEGDASDVLVKWRTKLPDMSDTGTFTYLYNHVF